MANVESFLIPICTATTAAQFLSYLVKNFFQHFQIHIVQSITTGQGTSLCSAHPIFLYRPGSRYDDRVEQANFYYMGYGVWLIFCK